MGETQLIWYNEEIERGKNILELEAMLRSRNVVHVDGGEYLVDNDWLWKKNDERNVVRWWFEEKIKTRNLYEI